MIKLFSEEEEFKCQMKRRSGLDFLFIKPAMYLRSEAEPGPPDQQIYGVSELSH